jgi:Mor family transcriptional regulator
MENNRELFNELEELIGAETAQVLLEHFAGTSVYFPRNFAIDRLHEQMRSEYKNGSGYDELAKRYGYSASHIRAIIHKKNIIDNGPDLGL